MSFSSNPYNAEIYQPQFRPNDHQSRHDTMHTVAWDIEKGERRPLPEQPEINAKVMRAIAEAARYIDKRLEARPMSELERCLAAFGPQTGYSVYTQAIDS